MEFMVKVGDNGQLEFATSKMERNYQEMIRFYKNTGTYFRFKLVDVEKISTENQHKLFTRICMMVVAQTGQDYSSVKNDFLKECSIIVEVVGLFGKTPQRRKTIEELTVKEFQQFLENVIVRCNSFHGMQLEMYAKEGIGTVLTTRREL